MSAKKILMVLTSHDELGDTGHKTGFWVTFWRFFGEFAIFISISRCLVF